MNEFNYQYKTLEKLLSKIDKVKDKSSKLKKQGIKTDITIQKSKHGYWNLKLSIYNENTEGNKEIRVFNQRA